MTPVYWSDTARRDFLRQIAYIAEDSPRAAAEVAHQIRQTADRLGEMLTGRPGRAAGVYEKVVRRLPYILVYRLVEDRSGSHIRILRLMHTSQDWPSAF